MQQAVADEPEWLQEKRKNSLAQFEKLQWPNFRYGLTMRMDYSDFNTEVLDTQGQQSLVLPSHAHIIVMPLHDAIKNHEEKIKPYLMEFFEKDNKFTAFHRAQWNDGIFVYVPHNVEVKSPIIIKRKASGTVIHHNLIVLNEGSSVSIIEELEGGDTFCSNVTEIIVKHGATCTFTSVQDYNNVFHFDHKVAHVEQDGKMNWRDVCLGSTFTHSTVQSLLLGSGADTRIKQLFFGNNQRFDIGAEAVHAASHTTSDIVAKGVLNGKAKSIYRGLVRIEQNAPASNGYQKEDVLMLSEEAESDSIPQLEIDNNDVKCSHAATTSHVDDEKLFYLMARGLDKERATELYVQGFLDPSVKDLDNADKIREKILEKLNVTN